MKIKIQLYFIEHKAKGSRINKKKNAQLTNKQKEVSAKISHKQMLDNFKS